jgi:carboxymethylenebutenolidase
VLRQLGLLPEYVRFPYSIEEKEAPTGKRYEVALPIVGNEGSRKLVDEGSEASNVLLEKKWRVVDDV